MPAATEENRLPNMDGLEGIPDAAPTPSLHPQAAEILRQVEFYFSNDNLRQDPHLLGLFQEGKGSVSFNEICSFKKMRAFKPKSAVREVLRQSALIEVSADGKRLMRKTPLAEPVLVTPKINPNRKKVVIPEDKPWLTKGMMKPTGFEDYATDGPIKPDEYEQDRIDYDPDSAFTSRIETAITRFCARRKMHQETRKVFEKFMIFGGMDDGQRQFTGGQEQDMTKKEIAELTSHHAVSERVLDGLYDDVADQPATWMVDFEAVAKAFLSSHFTTFFDWYDNKKVATAVNVLRNFYNYLLLHDVCPEYKDQLMAAREACDLAEEELPMLREADLRLPGGFNIACSTLFGGKYAGLYASGSDWVREDDDVGWSKTNAEVVFKTAIFAHGTDAQLLALEKVPKTGMPFKVVSSEDLGLEITSVELADEAALSIYESTNFTNTILRPMGKLKCKRWQVPHASPLDLPASVRKAQRAERFEIIVDQDALKYCKPGIKMECCVKELDIGVKWIDYIEAMYASFFTWLPNENIRDWKEPGPPTAWMLRQMGMQNDDEVGDAEGTEEGVGENDEAD